MGKIKLKLKTVVMYQNQIIPMCKIFWGGTLLFIDVLTAPSFRLIFFVIGAMIIDFITGVTKSKIKKVARTSEGYRKTVIKFLQYIVPMAVLWACSAVTEEYRQQIRGINGFFMLFVIYIEVTSIFENLYEMDKGTPVAKNVYRWALKILKLGLENNAVKKTADKLDQDNKTTDHEQQ